MLAGIRRIAVENVLTYLETHTYQVDVTGVSHSNFDLSEEESVFKSKSVALPSIVAEIYEIS